MTGRYGPPAPKPDNLDEMSAAYASGDKVRIAQEVAKYNEQLRQAGYAQLYEVLDAPDVTQPTRSPETDR